MKLHMRIRMDTGEWKDMDFMVVGGDRIEIDDEEGLVVEIDVASSDLVAVLEKIDRFIFETRGAFSSR